MLLLQREAMSQWKRSYKCNFPILSSQFDYFILKINKNFRLSTCVKQTNGNNNSSSFPGNSVGIFIHQLAGIYLRLSK